MWRLVDHRIDAAHLPKVREARAAAREAAWAAGAAPPAGAPLYIDIDATLVIDHSDNKAQAAPARKIEDKPTSTRATAPGCPVRIPPEQGT